MSFRESLRSSFDFAPLALRYAQDEREPGSITVRPERSEAESKGVGEAANKGGFYHAFGR